MMKNTKFVLKGFWDDDPAYYVKVLEENYNGRAVVHLSTSVDEAQKFDTPETKKMKILEKMLLISLIH